MIMQYDTVTVTADVNPVILAGMCGLVMDLTDRYAEVMFTSETGITYTFDGKSTFEIPLNYLVVPEVA